MTSPVSEIAPGIFRVRDTCNVYVVRPEADPAAPPAAERTAFAIDFGSGRVLDHLAELGVDRLTDVLMTHHHRDQAQGLPRAVAAGIRIHVPPVEQDLFARVEEMWSSRQLYNDYNLRQDKFSLLESVPVHDIVPEYRTRSYAGTRVEVLPTPGHTTGSVTYLVERGGRRLAFTGDLIYRPGKVWSLASTQWSYTENEGPAMTVLSCYLLAEREPSLLLPSHGEVMDDPRAALELLSGRMQEYVDSRRPHPWDLRARLDNPYRQITEHLLLNDTSNACSYVLRSDSGAALVFDYGYDLSTGLPAGGDRASRRPWLASLPALRRNHGVTTIDAVLPTHYHDDHVAGINLLRDVEGTQVWAPANVAPILESPLEQELPCTWYDPIRVDRELPLEESFTWHEYEITVHEQAGHTRYAAAYEFVVDGVTVLVTGDQQEGLGVRGARHEVLNYQYRNGFRVADFRSSVQMYRRVAPGLMVTGHWTARWVDEDYLAMLDEGVEQLARLHDELLPGDELNLGADGVWARISPYFSEVRSGTKVSFQVTLTNPYGDEQWAEVRLVAPAEWRVEPDVAEALLPAAGSTEVVIEAVVQGPARRRARVAVEVTIGGWHLGQHAEALLDVLEAG
jgi:glyoxylase-like metal-dependent hydrolase (beta-lactamase superfamily II)